MMASSPVLRSITIERFRGFLDQRTLRLDASVTIVAGPNGSGKTSLFDALQWLLLGEISRLGVLTTRRSVDYVINRFAPAGEPAVVSAELLIDDQHVVIRREGTSKENVLSWHDGPETLTGSPAEERLCTALLGTSELSLGDTMLTSGLLQQDVIRAVLEDQPKDRYRRMATMLGLTEIAGFEDEAKARSEEGRKEASRLQRAHEGGEADIARERAELQRLEQRILSQPEFKSAVTEMKSRVTASEALSIKDLPAASPDAVALGQWARRVRNEAAQLLSNADELRAQEAELKTADAAQLELSRAREAELEADLVAARSELEAVADKRSAAQKRASQLTELASRALPLLGDRCPVCDQRIDEAEIATHLREVLSADGDDLVGLRSAEEAAGLEVTRLEEAFQSASGVREQMERVKHQLDQVAATRRSWLSRCKELSDEASERVSTKLRPGIERGEAGALEALRVAADLVAGVADELGALLGASGLSAEVERQRRVVSELVVELADRKSASSEQSARAAAAKNVATAATNAVAGVTRKRFATLQPLLDDIFRRLDPHPVFRTLGFDLDVAYRSGVADPVVRDPEEGVTGDPLLVFSSSQANVAALTYFLALSWAAGPQALPFLLLDDPLQSMDDVNVLGFSDLCRHIRDRRQLVLSTHERRLATLLERKLMPHGGGDLTRVIQFRGWNRSGPVITEEEIVPATTTPFLLATP